MKTKKETIIFLCSLIMLCLHLYSCDKLPKNGDLDGMWQVTTIERGGSITDVTHERLYWSVQLNLFQYNTFNGQDIRYSRFNKSNDTLTLYDFCYNSVNATSADNNEWIPIEKEKDIKLYGITPTVDPVNKERIRAIYKIKVLNKNSMVLSNDNETITFRKI